MTRSKKMALELLTAGHTAEKMEGIHGRENIGQRIRDCSIEGSWMKGMSTKTLREYYRCMKQNGKWAIKDRERTLTEAEVNSICSPSNDNSVVPLLPIEKPVVKSLLPVINHDVGHGLSPDLPRVAPLTSEERMKSEGVFEPEKTKAIRSPVAEQALWALVKEIRKLNTKFDTLLSEIGEMRKDLRQK